MGEETALQTLTEMLQATITVYRYDGISISTHGSENKVDIRDEREWLATFTFPRCLIFNSDSRRCTFFTRSND